MIILHTEDFKVTAGHAKAFDKSLLIKQNWYLHLRKV
jgi:hypothetical protein